LFGEGPSGPLAGEIPWQVREGGRGDVGTRGAMHPLRVCFCRCGLLLLRCVARASRVHAHALGNPHGVWAGDPASL
jgi:hypothetical protein